MNSFKVSDDRFDLRSIFDLARHNYEKCLNIINVAIQNKIKTKLMIKSLATSLERVAI